MNLKPCIYGFVRTYFGIGPKLVNHLDVGKKTGTKPEGVINNKIWVIYFS